MVTPRPPGTVSPYPAWDTTTISTASGAQPVQRGMGPRRADSGDGTFGTSAFGAAKTCTCLLRASGPALHSLPLPRGIHPARLASDYCDSSVRRGK